MTFDDFFADLKDSCTDKLQREVLDNVEYDLRVSFEEVYADYREEARKNAAILKQMRELSIEDKRENDY